MFGESVTKATCLWLKGLPKLVPTSIVARGEFVKYPSGKRAHVWHRDMFNIPKKDRARMRSKTFTGVAKAMAEQWTKKNINISSFNQDIYEGKPQHESN